MTTWCRPDRDSTSSSSNRRGSCLVGVANKRHHHHGANRCGANYASDHHQPSIRHHRHQQSASRHSIADILGWSHRPASAATDAIKIEHETTTSSSSSSLSPIDHHHETVRGVPATATTRVTSSIGGSGGIRLARPLPGRRHCRRDLEEEEEVYKDDEADYGDVDEDDGMASDCVDVADMVISDEPLDLSLDKSKCRRERERERDSSGTPIKRAKVVVDTMEPASDGGTDEADMDMSQWGHVQPHLQMAANFSTVLQYYLTAARLWQTGEVMRCQESQQRAETDSEANDGGDDVHGTDQSAAVAAAVAAAAAAAAAESGLAVQSQPNNKRRKKDHAAADLAQSGDVANGARPRKTRTTFTGKQLFELERIFEQKKYLSSNERQEVARLLNVTGSQIKIWFQNRRTKWKKQDPNTAAELAQLKTASRSQQQATSVSAPKGKIGLDQSGSMATSAANCADISGGEEMNSDASSPLGQRSPSPV